MTCSAKTPPVLLHLPAARAWPRHGRSAGAWRPTPRSGAGGCPCRRAGGSRIRRASPCGGSRRGTWRRSADGDVALVDEDQGVVGEVFEEGRRRLAGLAAGEVARIVLDAGAGAGGLDHLEVEGACAAPAAALRAGCRRRRALEALLQLVLDALDRLVEGRARRDVVGVGVDLDELQVGVFLPVSGIELDDRLRSRRRTARCARRGPRSGRGRARWCRRARGTCRGRSRMSLRLYCRATRSAMQLALLDPLADLQREGHGRVGLDRADAVDAGDRGDDDDVVALQERARRRVAHAVDLLVDRGVLLDIGVGARHVGFGLVVVVVGDEILDRVVGEERS